MEFPTISVADDFAEMNACMKSSGRMVSWLFILLAISICLNIGLFVLLLCKLF